MNVRGVSLFELRGEGVGCLCCSSASTMSAQLAAVVVVLVEHSRSAEPTAAPRRTDIRVMQALIEKK